MKNATNKISIEIIRQEKGLIKPTTYTIIQYYIRYTYIVFKTATSELWRHYSSKPYLYLIMLNEANAIILREKSKFEETQFCSLLWQK